MHVYGLHSRKMLSSLQFQISHHMIINKHNSSSHFKLRLGEGSIRCSGVGFGKLEEDEMQLPIFGSLDPKKIPKHVAVIMDGNRRWARNRSLPPQSGHTAGRDAMKELALNCKKYGVEVLSLFAFSTENWARPKEEVDFLMSLFQETMQSGIEELIQNDVRVIFLGNRKRIPESLEEFIFVAEERGKGNQGLNLVLALNYSGRYDITQATKKIAAKVKDGLCKVEDIDETMVEQHLQTSGVQFPNPDLMIRTSGELRVSNFMLWQLAYTEMFFTNKLFPDFNEADLLQAFTAFHQRHRRFGGQSY